MSMALEVEAFSFGENETFYHFFNLLKHVKKLENKKCCQ